MYHHPLSPPQTNYVNWTYAVRPGTAFAVNIVGYFTPSTLTVTYTLPSGAAADVSSGTSSSTDAIRVKVSWTPSNSDVGVHYIQTAWSASGATNKQCDFEVCLCALAVADMPVLRRGPGVRQSGGLWYGSSGPGRTAGPGVCISFLSISPTDTRHVHVLPDLQHGIWSRDSRW